MSDKAQREEDRLVKTPNNSSNRGPNISQCSEDREKLKSQVRSCVMQVLTERLNKPAEFSRMDNAILTELIQEYLEWMGYNRTLESFQKECQLPQERNAYVLNQLPQLSGKGEDILPQLFYVVKKFKETYK